MDVQNPYVPVILTERPTTLNLTYRVINTNFKTSKVKCLFGKSDPLDTQRMLEEQYQEGRTRLHERFGIDIDEMQDLENRQGTCNINMIVNKGTTKNNNKLRVLRKRKITGLNQQHQAKITSKKNCNSNQYY